MAKRRRGSMTGRLPGRPPTPSDRVHRGFELLVERALAGIPAPFSDALREVAVVIEDEPSRRLLVENDLDPDDDTLYGLYEGVPRLEWGADSVPMPNKITLFRIPLQEDFPHPDDLADEVRITVIHELAHHLGIDDDRLEELGVD
ncbi:MAG: hypothetical protein RL338_844 [Chloroflexota bacterium]|jgi:predicted Zn-dependent protease with MMP-like domain